MKYYFLALGTVVVVCVGCAMDGQQITRKGEYHAPPAQMMMQPGPMVDLPYPAIMAPLAGGGPGGMGMGGMGMGGAPAVPKTTQVMFMGPEGMSVGWQVPGGFAENQLSAPSRYNFQQGSTYRLKITKLPGPGRENLALYPTLQVYPEHRETESFLSHESVPITLTAEDLDQIESNNFVTKVIYLPDPKYQELAIANVETLVSTRLDPGIDPVLAADQRGTIMAVLRVGNVNLELNGGAGQGPIGQGDSVSPVSFQADGAAGQFVPPMPVGPAGTSQMEIPGPMMVAGGGVPGQPISGVNTQAWGMPSTGTPIGLPGPVHLPYGGPASLKSHTIRNRTRMDLPKPVDHFLVDVRHRPGYSLPAPVKYVEYTEDHPVYSPGELSNPAFANPGGAGAMGGQYCPPGAAMAPGAGAIR